MSTRIMIIDNNQEHLDTLSKELLIRGNNIATYNCAEEGYADFFKFQPHLFICEPVLSQDGIRGWEIAFNILKDDFIKTRPYMVALANVQSRVVKALCEETGYDEFHIKPIDLHQLLGWAAKAKIIATENNTLA